MKGYNIFQSTLPREERLSLSRLIPTHSNFNPRFHERSDVSGGNESGSGSDFNPRFHERSDRTVDDGGCSIFISIHASTRGATDKEQSSRVRLQFQSTLPREERRLSHPHHSQWRLFQSTLPREERPSSSCVVHPTTLFQSTLPREERLIL